MAGSRPCSAMSRRTTGDRSRPPPLAGRGRLGPAAAAAGAAGAERGRRSGGSAGRRRGSAAGAGAGSRQRALPQRRAGSRARAPPPAVADHGQHRADVDGVALGHLDLGERAAHRRRHLGVDLVGGDLEQRLVLDHRLAHLLEPLRDRALGDGLTELGHRDVSHGGRVSSYRWACGAHPCSAHPCRGRPVREIMASPRTSLMVGWGWISAAMSSTVASQLTAR